jgi:hypothetical protein
MRFDDTVAYRDPFHSDRQHGQCEADGCGRSGPRVAEQGPHAGMARPRPVSGGSNINGHAWQQVTSRLPS